jgi:hypothetical protein
MRMNIRVFLSIVAASASLIAFGGIVKSSLGSRGTGIEGLQNTDYWGLCFTAEQENSSVSMSGSPGTVSLLYSYDGATWTPFIIGETTVLLTNEGDKVYLKAGPQGNTNIAPINGTRKFVLTGKIAASGSIASLLNGEVNSTTMKGQFYNLFGGCTSLTTAPELPFTSDVGNHAYRQMFFGCTHLTKSPYLPAKSIGTYAYYSMFYNCTALNEVHCELQSFSSNNLSWLHNVSKVGTFHCTSTLGTNQTISRGESACPKGWTVVNDIP